MTFAQENLPYRCGNTHSTPSRYNFLKRRRLEKQLNYQNYDNPMFLYAYRAFVDAFAKQDLRIIDKMCEAQLAKSIRSAYQGIAKRNGELFVVDKDIKMKLYLIQSRIVGGVYIDRAKNGRLGDYRVLEKGDRLTYEKLRQRKF